VFKFVPQKYTVTKDEDTVTADVLYVYIITNITRGSYHRTCSFLN